MILETFPSPEEFYKTYWGKKPFIVRGYIDEALIDSLIDGDTLAGLSLEDGVRSRIITNNAAGNDWVCEYGPFDNDRFDEIGDKNWSLLVQNVEQYHTETAELLKYFQFSPRWLLDDIMVSFSASGGSVGPHTDSYHTFLVQGVGKRTWKISDKRVDDDRYADNLDVKVLQHGFEGEVYEVTTGDTIYMPPFFGHEGKTIDSAMTFSVGFLGPKLSEMLGEYAIYLEDHEAINTRYLGTNLNTDSAAFTLGLAAQKDIHTDILSALGGDDFARWMASYFAAPTHVEIEDVEAEETLLSEELYAALKNGATLHRAEQTKLVITMSNTGGYHIAFAGEGLTISAAQAPLIDALNKGQDISYNDIENAKNQDETIATIAELYRQNTLCLTDTNFKALSLFH